MQTAPSTPSSEKSNKSKTSRNKASTGAIVDTVTWLPHQIHMPTATAEDIIIAAANDLTHALNQSDKSPLLPPHNTHTRTALIKLHQIFTDRFATPLTPLPTATLAPVARITAPTGSPDQLPRVTPSPEPIKDPSSSSPQPATPPRVANTTSTAPSPAPCPASSKKDSSVPTTPTHPVPNTLHTPGRHPPTVKQLSMPKPLLSTQSSPRNNKHIANRLSVIFCITVAPSPTPSSLPLAPSPLHSAPPHGQSSNLASTTCLTTSPRIPPPKLNTTPAKCTFGFTRTHHISMNPQPVLAAPDFSTSPTNHS